MWLRVALLVACAGCDVVFGLEPYDPRTDRGPCEVGERGILPGRWRSGALLEGKLVAGYERGDDALLVQVVEDDGRILALPLVVSEVGENLRVSAGSQAAAVITYHTSAASGWNQVASTSFSGGTLADALAFRTPTGVHATRAIGIPHAGGFLLAYRREVPGNQSYALMVATYDPTWTELAERPLDLSLGTPLAIGPTNDGFLLQTTDHMIPLDRTGTAGVALPTIGYDEISLVDSTPPAAPALVRSSGGGIELVALDELGQQEPPTTVASGRMPIAHLHARDAAAGPLLIWQEGEAVFAMRSVPGAATEPVEVLVTGTGITPVAIAEGASGPLAFLERDDASGAREVVAVQLCRL